VCVCVCVCVCVWVPHSSSAFLLPHAVASRWSRRYFSWRLGGLALFQVTGDKTNTMVVRHCVVPTVPRPVSFVCQPERPTASERMRADGPHQCMSVCTDAVTVTGAPRCLMRARVRRQRCEAAAMHPSRSLPSFPSPVFLSFPGPAHPLLSQPA